MRRKTAAPRLVTYVGHELHERAQAYAEQTGHSLSTILMLALRAYLDANAPSKPGKGKGK